MNLNRTSIKEIWNIERNISILQKYRSSTFIESVLKRDVDRINSNIWFKKIELPSLTNFERLKSMVGENTGITLSTEERMREMYPGIPIEIFEQLVKNKVVPKDIENEINDKLLKLYPRYKIHKLYIGRGPIDDQTENIHIDKYSKNRNQIDHFLIWQNAENEKDTVEYIDSNYLENKHDDELLELFKTSKNLERMHLTNFVNYWYHRTPINLTGNVRIALVFMLK